MYWFYAFVFACMSWFYAFIFACMSWLYALFFFFACMYWFYAFVYLHGCTHAHGQQHVIIHLKCAWGVKESDLVLFFSVFIVAFFFAFLFVFWYFYPLLLAAANNSAGNSQGNGAIDENRLRQHTIFSSRDSANGKNKRALKKGTAAIPLFVCLSTVHPLYPF